jgi:serine/threonine-protein kinase haspin
MDKKATVRKYGRQATKPKCTRLFAELPQTPIRKSRPVAKTAAKNDENDDIEGLTQNLSSLALKDEHIISPITRIQKPLGENEQWSTSYRRSEAPRKIETPPPTTPHSALEEPASISRLEDGLRILSWAEVCPPSDRIVKIAEASYAEVYRVTNDRGTSIIKVIRMQSPIRAQTKTQRNSGLIDEEPHSESDLMGELQISEWLADIPGFVVYKERYIVKGKACRELLETHQAFHKRAKRQDPGRLQFYPSPSRYLEDTKFLVVELGDAGIALEDFHLESADQFWDIFFHVAIALARAEAQVEFEVRISRSLENSHG